MVYSDHNGKLRRQSECASCGHDSFAQMIERRESERFMLRVCIAMLLVGFAIGLFAGLSNMFM